MVFQGLLGLRIYIAFALIFVSALLETFGLVMLMPLLQLVVMSPDEAIEVRGTGEDSSAFNFLSSSLPPLQASTLLSVIAAAFLLKGILAFASHYYVALLKGELLRILKNKSVRAFFSANYVYVSRLDSGHISNAINEQTNRAIVAFNQLSLTVSQIIISLVYVSIAFLLAPTFGFLIIVSGILLFFIFRILNRRVGSLSKRFVEASANLQRVLNELITDQKLIRATATAKHFEAYSETVIENSTVLQIQIGKFAAITHSVREPLAVSVVCMLLFILMESGYQNLSAVLVALLLYYRGLNSLLTTQSFLQATLEYMGSAYKAVDQLSAFEKNSFTHPSAKLDSAWKTISADNLFFSYGENPPVLQNLNFSISRNAMIGLVGKSGSGKTTLIDLICGLMPSDIRVDGHRISTIAAWGEQIGYVSQSFSGFEGSLLKNIAMKDDLSTVEEENLRFAVEHADLDDLIRRLPNGLHTPLVEGGRNLSGGELQRLLIARALYRRPSLMILDEATSALDVLSEERILTALNRLKRKVTIIFVSHRLTALKNCDEIWIMNDGQISSTVSYEHLQDNFYREFAHMNKGKNVSET